MSAEQTPDIETVLAEHEWLQYVEYGPCTCGDLSAFTAATHRAHVAQALAPVLAAAVRDAEQRAWLRGYEFALHNIEDEAVQSDLQRLTAGVNAGPDVSVPSDGAVDAPNEAKGALAQQPPAPAVTYRADRVAEPQHEAALNHNAADSGDDERTEA